MLYLKLRKNQKPCRRSSRSCFQRVCSSSFRALGFLGALGSLCLTGSLLHAAVVSTDMTSNTANSAPFTGSQAIEITNGATVQLNAAHNFSGPVTISDGRLVLNMEGGFLQSTVFNVGANGVLEFASKSPFSSAMDVIKTITIEEGGLLTFTAQTGDKFANVDHLVLNGGTIAGETAHGEYGSYLFRGNLTVNKSSSITANFTIRSKWGVVDKKPVWNVAKDATLAVSGKVRFAETDGEGNLILTKTGDGTVLFTNSANYVGANSELVVNGGTVEARKSNSFSNGNALKITVNNGKMLFSGSDSGTINNNIFIAEGANAEINSSANRTYSGSVTGKGTFAITNNGWVYTYLTGDNSAFEGVLKDSAKGGVVFFQGAQSAMPNAVYQTAESCTACFLPASADDSVFSFGSLSGNGTLRPSQGSAADFTIQVGGLNQDSTFNGQIIDYDDSQKVNYAKGITLEKIGSGALTLTNANNKFRNGLVVKNGSVKFTAPGAAGTGSISLTKTSDSEFGRLVFEGEGNVTNNVNLAEGTTFAFTAVDKNTKEATVYSGNLTGSGTFISNSPSYLRLDGDNTSFAGVFQSSGTYVFFQNSLSASPNAKYEMTNPFVLKPNEANAVYQFGSVNWTGSEVRYSWETNQNCRNATLSIGYLNADDYIKQAIKETIALEKVGSGTLTLEKPNDGNYSYSLGTTVKDGTIKVSKDVVVGSSVNDLFLVEAATDEISPAIILEGTVNGRLEVNGQFIIDFADGSMTDVGSVTGDLIFGDDATLAFILPDDGKLADATYSLFAANSDDLLLEMLELYRDAVEAGNAPDGFSVSAIENGLLISAAQAIVPTAGVPEPAAPILLLLGSIGLFFLKNRKK